MSQDISSQVEALRSDLAALAQRFAEYADRDVDALGAAVSRGARTARRAFNQKVAAVADQTTEMADAARAQASDLQDAVEVYVIENPFRSLAIAVGVGWLLGVVGRR
jgi:ElaB/YqjD/DUF883 family membrane-anchored ribosome-binding protein